MPKKCEEETIGFKKIYGKSPTVIRLDKECISPTKGIYSIYALKTIPEKKEALLDFGTDKAAALRKFTNIRYKKDADKLF